MSKIDANKKIMALLSTLIIVLILGFTINKPTIIYQGQKYYYCGESPAEIDTLRDPTCLVIMRINRTVYTPMKNDPDCK